MLFKKKEVTNGFVDQPKYTMDVVRFEDILIPKEFERTNPSSNKIAKYIYLFQKYGHLDKPITVIAEISEKGKKNKLVLVDGYIRYLVAKAFHLEKVPVIYQDINTYEIRTKLMKAI